MLYKVGRDTAGRRSRPPPRVIVANGTFWQVRVVEKGIHAPVEELQLWCDHAKGLKAMLIAGHDVSSTVTLLEELAQKHDDRIRANPIANLGKAGSSVPVSMRLQFVKERKREIGCLMQLRQSLADLENIQNLQWSSQKAKSASHGLKWLNRPVDWSFGRKFLQRQKRSQTSSGVNDEEGVDTWKDIPAVLSEMLASGAVAWTSEEQDQYRSGLPLMSSIVDVLYTVPISGYGIRVKRTEASIIEPWLVVVEYVSADKGCTTTERMQCLECHEPITDAKGEDCIELISCDRRVWKTQVYKAWVGICMSRNPALTLPYSDMALLCVSLVKACEQIIRAKMVNASNGSSDLTFEAMVPAIQTAMALFDAARERVRFNKGFRCLATSCCEQGGAVYMTEKGGGDGNLQATSMAKVLCALCCDGVLFSAPQHQQNRTSIALLSEAVSRSCRTAIRRQFHQSESSSTEMNVVVRHQVQQALGIKPQDVMGSVTKQCPFDINKGIAHTNRFFNKVDLSNASVFAIISMVGFSRIYLSSLKEGGERNVSERRIFDAYNNGIISMRGFVADAMPQVKRPVLVQLNLFIQGMLYHKSAQRCEVCEQLVDEMLNTPPHSLLKRFAIEECQRITQDHAAEELRILKETKHAASKGQRLELRKRIYHTFMEQHSGAPTIFNLSEIEDMNKLRPANDQLEFCQHSSLLKHHCCFPKCPYFLVNQSTVEDRVSGSRRGIFNHFNGMHVPRLLPGGGMDYVPGLHVHATAAARSFKFQQSEENRQRFVAIVLKKIPQNRLSILDADILIGEIWASFQRHCRTEGGEFYVRMV